VVDFGRLDRNRRLAGEEPSPDLLPVDHFTGEPVITDPLGITFN
jgi:hypothetical protein